MASAEESVLEKKVRGDQEPWRSLLKNSTHMRVGCINGVSKDRDRGKEELGVTESGVKDRGPQERFTRTPGGIG